MTEGEVHSRARVLLVEDDNSLRRYVEVTLQRAGYEVLSAADGLEAMKLALTSHVDIVITDAMMPNLSGHELGRFLRNSNLQCEIASCIQRDVAAHSTAGR